MYGLTISTILTGTQNVSEIPKLKKEIGWAEVPFYPINNCKRFDSINYGGSKHL